MLGEPSDTTNTMPPATTGVLTTGPIFATPMLSLGPGYCQSISSGPRTSVTPARVLRAPPN